MEAAFYLLLTAGCLGLFDIAYFHIYRCRLAYRAECQREVLLHTLRHAVYAIQFIVVANLRFHGWALVGLATLYAADVAVALADVLEETKSRGPQGGLPRGEYFMHVVLSLLVGAYLLSVAQVAWADRLLATAIVVDPPHVPDVLRVMMNGMAVSALGVFAHDLLRYFAFRRTLPATVS